VLLVALTLLLACADLAGAGPESRDAELVVEASPGAAPSTISLTMTISASRKLRIYSWQGSANPMLGYGLTVRVSGDQGTTFEAERLELVLPKVPRVGVCERDRRVQQYGCAIRGERLLAVGSTVAIDASLHRVSSAIALEVAWGGLLRVEHDVDGGGVDRTVSYAYDLDGNLRSSSRSRRTTDPARRRPRSSRPTTPSATATRSRSTPQARAPAPVDSPSIGSWRCACRGGVRVAQSRYESAASRLLPSPWWWL
jgi:hypothetical protein